MKPGASKATKIPYSARTGVPASTTDPLTWATFNEAVAAKTANDAYAGIGFVFTAGDPYVGIDLDNCIDAVSGELTAEAKGIVTAIDSYTERTPSGNGLHIIARGTLPAGGRKKGAVEMYDAARYFTMTGDSWPETNCVIENRTAELCELHQRVFGHSKPSRSAAPAVSPAPGASDQTDDQVLAAIRASSSASTFESLFAGDWPRLGYPSQSEADLALAGILAIYTGGDEVQIDRLFRASGLYRDKWDEQRGEKTYGEKTIAKALEENIESNDREAANDDDQGTQGGKAQALAKFNERFAVVRTGNGLRILEEHRDGAGRVERVSFLNQADFGLAVRNWSVPGQKKGNGSNWWLSQPARREYRTIDFNPGGTKEGEYNLWQGFPVIARAGDCHLFWQFVQEVICAGDAKQYQYLRRYMAHTIQRPGERPEVAIVLRGGQGTGKNTFVETFGALVAPHFGTVNQMDQVIGRFNAHLMNRLVIHANEALWGGNKTEAGKLKAMITDPTFLIEQKGVDSIPISNYLRIFVSSNEDWAVPIDFDDRRFVIFDLSNCYKQDQDYFAAIYAERDRGGREALMYDLRYEDLEGFHPRNKPRSRFGFDMKVRSADTVTRWLYECLQAGKLVGEPGPLGGVIVESGNVWETSYAKDMVRLAYQYWCRQQNERHPMADSMVFKQLKRLLPEMGVSRPTDEKSRKRYWCATFPELGSARRSFEKAMNAEGQIEWQPE